MRSFTVAADRRSSPRLEVAVAGGLSCGQALGFRRQAVGLLVGTIRALRARRADLRLAVAEASGEPSARRCCERGADPISNSKTTGRGSPRFLLARFFRF